MTRYVTIKLFSKISSYTENAIHSKKSRGVRLQDSDWCEALDGKCSALLVVINHFRSQLEHSCKLRLRIFGQRTIEYRAM